jgi:hypothetical protein
MTYVAIKGAQMVVVFELAANTIKSRFCGNLAQQYKNFELPKDIL